MNKLPVAKRTAILECICQGASLGSIARTVGVWKKAVADLFHDAGNTCLQLHHRFVRNLNSRRVDCQGIWSFSAPYQETTRDDVSHNGDVWTWAALDFDTGLIISYLVGDRSPRSVNAFLSDVQGRVAPDTQLITDQIRWESPDNAKSDLRHAKDMTGQRPRNIEGLQLATPGLISNSDRPFASVSNALDIHIHTLAIYFAVHNFCRIRPTSGVTPAMANGIIDRPWTLTDILGHIDATASVPKLDS